MLLFTAKGWGCDFIKHKGTNCFDTNDVLYGCETTTVCNWGICLACVQKVARWTESANFQRENGESVTCHNSHNLVYESEKISLNISKFICDLCVRLYPKTDVRWQCKQCDVDYCFSCVPFALPPGIEYISEKDADVSHSQHTICLYYFLLTFFCVFLCVL